MGDLTKDFSRSEFACKCGCGFADMYNPQGLKPCKPICRKRTTSSEVWDRIGGGPYVRLHTGYPQSIIQFKREQGAVACQKPVALLEWLIRTYTWRNEVVLDNTMGTGSSGVAAANAERSFVGIEADSERFHAAEERIAEAMAQHGVCRARTLYSPKGTLA